MISLALAHQRKIKADSKTSISAKSSSSSLRNKSARDSHDSNIPLQQTVGNQAVQRSVFSNNAAFDFAKIGIQPKLKVSQPGDAYEQEADRIAEQVMRMSSDDLSMSSMPKDEERVSRKCSSCEMKEKEDEKHLNISRKPSTASNFEATDESANEINNFLSGDGSSLDSIAMEFMESRFGYDFSNVKIHTGEMAARSIESVNALAYTVGNNIVFGEGRYQPNTLEGRRSLAHELVHTIQQGAGPQRVQRQVDNSAQQRPQNTEDATVEEVTGPLVDWAQVLGDNRMLYIMERLLDHYNFPANGAAGLVGNLWAESGALPSRIEGSRQETPLRAPNFAGSMTDFTPEQVTNRNVPTLQGPRLPGVGLAQWTTAARRRGLFQHQFGGQTVGAAILFNMDAQIDYLVTEIQANYNAVHNVLTDAGVTINDASDEVVYSFERPGAIIQAGHRLPRQHASVQAVFSRRRISSQRALQIYRRFHP